MAGALLMNGGVDLLEKLQEHQERSVYELARQILSEFYQVIDQQNY